MNDRLDVITESYPSVRGYNAETIAENPDDWLIDDGRIDPTRLPDLADIAIQGEAEFYGVPEAAAGDQREELAALDEAARLEDDAEAGREYARRVLTNADLPTAPLLEGEPADVGVTDAQRRGAAAEVTELGDGVSADAGALEELRDIGIDALDSDRVFTTNAPGNEAAEFNVSVYESGSLSESVGSVTFEEDSEVGRFVRYLSRTPDDVDPSALIEGSAAIEEAAARRDARRETREAARDAAEAAGVDLNEFDVAAAYGEDAAPGTVVIQDRDTGETRRIEPDAPGGVGSAIDAATGEGQFVADDADPAASGSGFGDGLGVRAAGAVVLLFAAIAAALGWLS